ncbi:MAG TPA: hypothetical protein DCG75_02345 [Bacteroidales bacterium]|jgi:hypothetical protein|nr:hypothetical protein [Bacteroidales bacterium]
MKLKNLLSTFAIATVVLMTACSKDDDNVASLSPTVISTDPSNDATDVTLNKIVTATFSEAMNPLTIGTSTFTLKQGEEPVAGTVSYTGTTASFTPSNHLLANTSYTANITKDAKNASGMAMVSNFEWNFTTGSLTAPSVISTSPVNNAVDVNLDKVVTATFSEAMDPLTINTSSFSLKQGDTEIEGTVSYTGTTATFTPTNMLETETNYTATITSESKNIAGFALANNKIWSFTTGLVPDVILPTIISTDPAGNDIDVMRNTAIKAYFSEKMDPLTINTSSFTLMQGDFSVDGSVSYTDSTATFTPTDVLTSETIYVATITNDVTDLNGNALTFNKVWSFTTGVLPDDVSPEITLTDPENNAMDVIRSKTITATFSEEMDPLSISTSTFILKQGLTTIPGMVEYFGTTATFNPTNTLEAETVYTATITTEVKDTAGNALAADKVWSFTTATASTGLAVVDLGTAENYVILAESAISNTPTSDITGDLGLSPAATSYITGLSLVDHLDYATSAQVTGEIYAATMADPTPASLTTAVSNMVTAYEDAKGRPTPDFLELGTGNIGGKTLVPGLYKWTNTVTLPTDVTISGGTDDVWIFQISGDLTMSAAVNVTLIGGAQAKNIFWQVAGEASFGATSHFEGIILSKTAIIFQTNASFKGRALSQTAVTLDGNVIIEP